MGTRNNKTAENTHWRTLKGLTKSLSNIENVNISSYNLDDVYCYQTLGSEMQGSNVTYFANENYSCFVGDNTYDIYEVPLKRQSSNKTLLPIEGKKLCLAYNKDYNYWLFSEMEYYINNDSVKSTSMFSDSASFSIYGSYLVNFIDNDFNISKKYSGDICTFGTTSSTRSSLFDSLGTRKAAYQTSEAELVSTILGTNFKEKPIIDKHKVKIYKKINKRK